MPMLPEAPGLLSTTTCCPSRRPRNSATTRALVSVTPPGVKGTMSRIGLAGQASWALAGADAKPKPAAASAAAASQRRRGVRGEEGAESIACLLVVGPGCLGVPAVA